MAELPSIPQTTFGTSAGLRGIRSYRDRDTIDLIVQRSEELPSADRALLLAVFSAGQSVLEIAQLQSRDVRLLRRRVRVLASRVLSPHFVFVLRCRADWNKYMREVGDAIFVRGQTIQEASHKLGLSYHTVRRYRDAICALEASSRSRSQPPIAVATAPSDGVEP